MQSVVVTVGMLEPGWVLSPERYEGPKSPSEGVPLRSLVQLVRQAVTPSKVANTDRFLVLDTSDVRVGVLDCEKPLVSGNAIGSTKKLVQPGDVLISRLRSYLRQVAYVDEDAAEAGVTICCSTEFHVLRSVSAESIGFLVPWLLSSNVQEFLAASQEGGHHPRFSDEALFRAVVPSEVVKERERLSQLVETASKCYRQSRQIFAEAAAAVQPITDLVGEAED